MRGEGGRSDGWFGVEREGGGVSGGWGPCRSAGGYKCVTGVFVHLVCVPTFRAPPTRREAGRSSHVRAVVRDRDGRSQVRVMRPQRFRVTCLIRS